MNRGPAHETRISQRRRARLQSDRGHGGGHRDLRRDARHRQDAGALLSNTTTARLRSLAAIEAASLASAMHSNRQYWANTALPFNAALSATGVITSSDGALAVQATADLALVPDDACNNVTCAALPLAPLTSPDGPRT